MNHLYFYSHKFKSLKMQFTAMEHELNVSINASRP